MNDPASSGRPARQGKRRLGLYPSVLTESMKQASYQLAVADGHPDLRTVQLDIIDGYFADNVTLTPADFSDCSFGHLTADIHLMVEEPLDYLGECVVNRTALPIRTVLGQIEKMSSIDDFIEAVSQQGWGAGLSLDLYTPLEEVSDDQLRELTALQLMGIEAGFQGQTLHPGVVYKIEQLAGRCRDCGHRLEIIIDGGVKLDNVEQLIDNGVHGVVVGSEIWQANQPDQVIDAYLRLELSDRPLI